MRDNKHFEEFGKPFPASDIGWRLQYVDKDKLEGFAVPFIDARAISDRLDAVVGQNRWKDTYEQWHSSQEEVSGRDGTAVKKVNSQLCTIYIYDEELKEWIGKTDGAENTDIESVKGGLSDAFKRCAVKWNIGRYLYKFEPVWVKAKKRNRGYVIDDTERSKLDAAYNAHVARIFGTQQAPKKKTQSTKTTETSAPNTAPVFEVRDVKIQRTPNGVQSALVLLNGERKFTAFLGGHDEKLRAGVRITNVQSRVLENDHGKFNVIQRYDIAA